MIGYAKGQENIRLYRLALALVIHECLLSPLAILIIATHGNIFALCIPSVAAFAAAGIVNLAAMPTTVIIQVLLLSVLVDVVVIITGLLL